MLTPEELRSEVHRLVASDPRGSVQDVPRLVAAWIAELDTQVELETTGAMNHSFIPDIVMSWPNLGIADSRPLFLRFTPDPETLSRDVLDLGSEKAVFVDLVGEDKWWDPEGSDWRAALTEVSLGSGSLVTSDDGLYILAEKKAESPVLGLLASSMARDGVGWLTARDATELGGVFSEGYIAAAEHEAAPTEAAIQRLERWLNSDGSKELVGFLQALWVGSGGVPQEFPAALGDWRGALSDAALTFLLGLDPVEDERFWRSIGWTVGLEQIQRLPLEGTSPNLEALVRGNADRIRCSACAVVSRAPKLTEEAEEPYWKLDDQRLALVAPNFTAFFATKREDATALTRDEGALTFAEFESRAATHEVDVFEVELVHGSERIAWGRRQDATASILENENLKATISRIGSDVPLRRAIVMSASGRQVTVDAESFVLHGQTVAQYSISELVRLAARVLVVSDFEEVEEVDEAAPLEAAGTFSVNEAESEGETHGQMTLRADLDLGP